MIGAIVAGGLSAMTAPVTNSYESIATTIVGSGGTSTITFSVIPSTFKHLQLRCFVLSPSLGGAGSFRLNSDSGSNYSEHFLQGSGSGTPSANYGANMSAVDYPFATGNTTSPSASILDILDYADTNKYKTLRALDGVDNNGNGYINFVSYGWRSTSAVNSITITGSFNQYSSFALYGIKG